MKNAFLSCALILLFAGCGDDGTATTDSGRDAASDTSIGMDATTDTGGGGDAAADGTMSDARADATADATADAMADATADAMADATADAMADATADAMADATRPDTSPLCRRDGDCGDPGCRNMGRNCVQVTPGCVGGACTTRSVTVRGGTCDTTSGLCTGGSVSCGDLCDCPQGLICPDGTCLAGIVAEYCCTNPGCPTGMRCTNADGSRDLCP